MEVTKSALWGWEPERGHAGLKCPAPFQFLIGTQDELSLFSSLSGPPLVSLSPLLVPYLDLYDSAWDPELQGQVPLENSTMTRRGYLGLLGAKEKRAISWGVALERVPGFWALEGQAWILKKTSELPVIFGKKSSTLPQYDIALYSKINESPVTGASFSWGCLPGLSVHEPLLFIGYIAYAFTQHIFKI